MDVRKQIAKDLEAAGLMEKVEDYDNKVGYSERTHVPIRTKALYTMVPKDAALC